MSAGGASARCAAGPGRSVGDNHSIRATEVLMDIYIGKSRITYEFRDTPALVRSDLERDQTAGPQYPAQERYRSTVEILAIVATVQTRHRLVYPYLG